jgi:DNA replication protein DnaC
MTREGQPDAIEGRVLERLGRLRLTTTRETLSSLLSEAARQQWTYLEFVDQLTRREAEAEQDKRVRMGMTIAHFPTVRTLEGFDFAAQPSVDERLVRELATGTFVDHGTNVLLFGAPGLGKTHLAIGLGRRLVELGHTVLFTTATGLLTILSKAESEGRLEEKVINYVKPRLLIVDELGYLPFERRAAHLFFQLVNRRYERGSMMITTNQRVSEWGTMFGDEVLATAILDRLLHHSETLMIKGESYRLREKRKSGLFRSLDEAEARASGRSQSEESRPAVGRSMTVDKRTVGR